MRCEDARLSISALLDGEALPMGSSEAEVDKHVASCAACRIWRAEAEEVTRLLRLQPVRVPDLTAAILTAAHADGSLPARRPQPAGRPASEPRAARLRAALRWALGLLAVAQLMLAIPELFGVAGHEAHAGREVAAFDIALAVGLLVAACYPEYARVYRPVVLTLVVCLASISVLDLLQGIVTPGRVAVHALALVQAGLIGVLAHHTPARPAPA